MLRSIKSIEHKEIILYGNGNSKFVFESFVLNKFEVTKRPEIIATVDRKILFNKFEEREFTVDWLLDETTLSKHNQKTLVVCIGILVSAREIQSQLLRFGYRNVCLMYDYIEFNCGYDDRAFLEIQDEIVDFYSANRSFFYDYLSDTSSLKIGASFLDLFLTGGYPSFQQSSSEDEQIETELGFIRKAESAPICALNAGAYRGEFALKLSQLSPKIQGTVYLVEPDPHNFSHISSNLSGLLDGGLDVVSLPIALGSGLGKVELQGSGVTSSARHLVDGTEEYGSVTSSSIDQIFQFAGLTHLVIDVEGAEDAVIRGGSNTIVSQNPNICISVYHYPMDLFRIPILLRQLVPAYKFFLRNYSGFHSDTLLYAVR